VQSRSFLFVFFLLIVLTFNAIWGRGPFSWGIGFVYIGYDTALLLFVAFQMIKILRHETTPSIYESAAPKPTLAVLITARNEAAVLERCLSALAAQSDLPDLVYWIDDGSTDESAAVLKKFQASHSLKIIPIFKLHSGKADSLNQVWPLAPAEIIVTLDADTILERDAIFEMRNAFALNPRLAVTGGLLTPRSLSRPGSFFENFQRFEYIRSFLARRAWMEKNVLVLVSGAFAAYRKSVLSQVGGYDPASLVEDYDLTHRIHRFSYENGLHHQVQVCVRARATTDVPVTLQLFLQQRKRWFGGFLQTHFKNSDMIGNPKYGSLGRIMLVIKSADTLQPIFGLVTLLALFHLLFSKVSLPGIIWIALLIKIILDLIFHYSSVGIYFRWRGERADAKIWALSTMATFLEPISFQIFRHFGALLGWVVFFSKKNEWIPQRESMIDS